MADRRRELISLNPKRQDRGLDAKIARGRDLLGRRMSGLIRQANAEGLAFIQDEARKNLQSAMRASRRPFRTGSLEDAITDKSNSEADGRGIRFMIDERVAPKVPYYHALEEGYSGGVGRKVPFIFLSQGGGGGNRPGSGGARGSTAGYTRIRTRDPVRGSGIHTEDGQRNNAGRDVASHRNARTDRIVGPSEVDRLGGSDPNVRARRITRGANKGKFIARGQKSGRGGIRVVTITRPVPAYHYAARAGEAFVGSGEYSRILDRLIGGSGLEAAGVRFVLSGR